MPPLTLGCVCPHLIKVGGARPPRARRAAVGVLVVSVGLLHLEAACMCAGGREGAEGGEQVVDGCGGTHTREPFFSLPRIPEHHSPTSSSLHTHRVCVPPHSALSPYFLLLCLFPPPLTPLLPPPTCCVYALDARTSADSPKSASLACAVRGLRP